MYPATDPAPIAGLRIRCVQARYEVLRDFGQEAPSRRTRSTRCRNRRARGQSARRRRGDGSTAVGRPPAVGAPIRFVVLAPSTVVGGSGRLINDGGTAGSRHAGLSRSSDQEGPRDRCSGRALSISVAPHCRAQIRLRQQASAALEALDLAVELAPMAGPDVGLQHERDPRLPCWPTASEARRTTSMTLPFRLDLV